MEKEHLLKMEGKLSTKETFKMGLSTEKGINGTVWTKLNTKETSKEIKWKAKAKWKTSNNKQNTMGCSKTAKGMETA